MITVKATFSGTNGSLGYVTGKQYTLTVKEFVHGGIWITDQEKKGGTCEYSCTMNFFENWDKINKV